MDRPLLAHTTDLSGDDTAAFVHASALAAASAARLVTVHDLTPVRYPELCSADTLAYPALIERAWRAGAWIHTDSAYVADEVRQWLRVGDADAHRVVPIHLGVDPPTSGDPTLE